MKIISAFTSVHPYEIQLYKGGNPEYRQYVKNKLMRATAAFIQEAESQLKVESKDVEKSATEYSIEHLLSLYVFNPETINAVIKWLEVGNIPKAIEILKSNNL